MAHATRSILILTLGVGLAVAATVQSAPQRPHDPAVEAIIKLADNLDKPGVAEEAKRIVATYDSCDISQIFRLRAKGGAGIGSAAQAGHKDSIQNLVMDWSGNKAPTEKELRTHRHDLLKAARVLRAMSELAPLRIVLLVPKNAEKQLQDAQKVAADFKTVTREFHDAIERTDAVATRRVAVALNNVCNSCHLLTR